ncbi:MAG: hypothetical protein MJB57_09990 [Gemmatimonadetes bacterium]|nr:hypothetical protein [Gemmatimonadota bacterium]
MTQEQKEPQESPEAIGLDPWGLRRVERLLRTVEGVDSLKIVPDGHGAIDEIHVLSSSGLGAKQIVRNIESALLAQFGLQSTIARSRSPTYESRIYRSPFRRKNPSPNLPSNRDASSYAASTSTVAQASGCFAECGSVKTTRRSRDKPKVPITQELDSRSRRKQS